MRGAFSLFVFCVCAVGFLLPRISQAFFASTHAPTSKGKPRSWVRLCADSPNLGEESAGKGFGFPKPLPKIPSAQDVQGSPSSGVRERLLLQYTCKVCKHRNSIQIAKHAYTNGLVLVTCKNSDCNSRHLIADNTNLLGLMPEKNIEALLKGDVKRVHIPGLDLAKYEVISKGDGSLEVVPKEPQ